MTAYTRRITVGQKAAICGLLLAGVGYVDACRVTDSNRLKMRAYVPRDWRCGKLPIPVRAMTAAQVRMYRKLVPIVGGDAAFAQAVTA